MKTSSRSLVFFIVPLFALALLIGCKPQTTNGGTASSSSVMPKSQDNGAVPAGFDGKFLTGTHDVVLKTSEGDISLTLDADKAPKTVTNFVVLARVGYYDGLNFHRIAPGFVIQGGDPNGNGTGGASIYGPTFEDEENDLDLAPGAVAMANRGPDTNGSQFFIVDAADTLMLQGYYTVFGKVTKGMDVVHRIAAAPQVSREKPANPVTFTVEVKD